MSITSKTLFKAIYWLYIVYYLAFVYVPYLKNKKEDKVWIFMYEYTYIEVAVSVLRNPIDEIAYQLHSNDLDEAEYESLHDESGKLHRAVNKLMELGWLGGIKHW